MTTSTMNQHDHRIHDEVTKELEWAPAVNATSVGVSVLDGAVTLSGEVDSYSDRIAATEAAQRVSGVLVVADELTVGKSALSDRTDTDIAASIDHVLRWSTEFPNADIGVEVRNHVVILTGVVKWNYQRLAVARLIRGMAGVHSITNHITLTPRVSVDDTSKLIKAALVRIALTDADGITVVSDGTDVTLTGTVHTWVEKWQAAYAAWSSPHVANVHNKLVVRP